jgi:hypothetical protein
MSIAIIVPLIILLGIRCVSLGCSYEKIFEHVSFPVFLIILAATPVIAAGFSFLIALWYRLATITVSSTEIRGRNFWGIRNQIPLTDITKLTPFSSTGINAIVVNSRYHGQIYISDKTEHLSELLARLEACLPERGEPPSAG